MIDENWLADSFSDNFIPAHWKCPHCKRGSLQIKDKLLRFETKDSRREPGDYRSQYRFAGILECIFCGDIVSVCGYAHDLDAETEDRDGKYVELEWTNHDPKFFYPPLHLFNLPKSLPQNVKKKLTQAFSLYWNDLPACANRIRSSVEGILTDKKIKQTQINKKGKRGEIRLHDRIDLFKQKFPQHREIGDLLLAVKWIGNEGSHFSDNLKRGDLFSAFELIESSISKLYPDEDQRIKELAKSVNRRKKITKKRTGISGKLKW